MFEQTNHNGQSRQPHPEEKKVATMAVRLPILIVVAVLLMLGVGLLAMQMYGS